MPYIKEELRSIVDDLLEVLVERIKDECHDDEFDGVLNYTISRIVSEVLPVAGDQTRYSTIAQAAAVFECAKLEFYRRVAGPKEDAAIVANGDIPAYQSRERINGY